MSDVHERIKEYLGKQEVTEKHLQGRHNQKLHGNRGGVPRTGNGVMESGNTYGSSGQGTVGGAKNRVRTVSMLPSRNPTARKDAMQALKKARDEYSRADDNDRIATDGDLHKGGKYPGYLKLRDKEMPFDSRDAKGTPVTSIPKGTYFMHRSGEMVSDGKGLAHRVDVGVATPAEKTPHKVDRGVIMSPRLSKALDRMLKAGQERDAAWKKTREVKAAVMKLGVSVNDFYKFAYPEQYKKYGNRDDADWSHV